MYGKKKFLLTDQSGNGECPADHLGLVHDLDDTRKVGNGLLGKLFLVKAKQAASQVEHAPVVAVAVESSNTGIGGAFEPLSAARARSVHSIVGVAIIGVRLRGWLCWSTNRILENATPENSSRGEIAGGVCRSKTQSLASLIGNPSGQSQENIDPSSNSSMAHSQVGNSAVISCISRITRCLMVGISPTFDSDDFANRSTESTQGREAQRSCHRR